MVGEDMFRRRKNYIEKRKVSHSSNQGIMWRQNSYKNLTFLIVQLRCIYETLNLKVGLYCLCLALQIICEDNGKH